VGLMVQVPGVQILGSGLWSCGSGLGFMVYGVLFSVLLTGSVVRFPGLGFRISNLRFRV